MIVYLFMTIIYQLLLALKLLLFFFLIIINDIPNSSHSTFSPLSLDAKRP